MCKVTVDRGVVERLAAIASGPGGAEALRGTGAAEVPHGADAGVFRAVEDDALPTTISVSKPDEHDANPEAVIYGPVEKLSSDRSDPSLSEGVRHRSPDTRLEDLEAFGAEDFVERVDELAASVSDQGSRSFELVAAENRRMSCLTSGLVGGRPGRR